MKTAVKSPEELWDLVESTHLFPSYGVRVMGKPHTTAVSHKDALLL